MSRTLQEIVAETSQWPSEQVAELVDRLTLTLHHADEAGVEDAWKRETRRRLAEIESGESQVVAGEEVSEQVRRIVSR